MKNATLRSSGAATGARTWFGSSPSWARLKCVCDTDASRLKALAFQGDSARRSRRASREVLDDPDIRAVAVATPAATHYEIVRQCLEAGKDVFVEKPLALTAEQGHALVELAEQAVADPHGRPHPPLPPGGRASSAN